MKYNDNEFVIKHNNYRDYRTGIHYDYSMADERIKLFRKYLEEIYIYQFPEFDGLHFDEDSKIFFQENGDSKAILYNSKGNLIDFIFNENGYTIKCEGGTDSQELYLKQETIMDPTKLTPAEKEKNIEINFRYGKDIVSIKGKIVKFKPIFTMDIYTNVPDKATNLKIEVYNRLHKIEDPGKKYESDYKYTLMELNNRLVWSSNITNIFGTHIIDHVDASVLEEVSKITHATLRLFGIQVVNKIRDRYFPKYEYEPEKSIK